MPVLEGERILEKEEALFLGDASNF